MRIVSDVLLLSYFDKIGLSLTVEAGQALAFLYSEARLYKGRRSDSSSTPHPECVCAFCLLSHHLISRWCKCQNFALTHGTKRITVCVSPVELSDGRGGGGGGGAKSIIRRRGSLVLYKSFNTHWFKSSHKKISVNDFCLSYPGIKANC
jgi:hypothetical protein